DADIVVIDGILEDTFERLAIATEPLYENKKKVVFLCSGRVSTYKVMERVFKVRTFLLPSWEFSEYEYACANGEFWDLVSVNFDSGEKTDTIEKKYHFAGGCARWFFSFDIAFVKSYIKQACIEVTDC